MIGFTPKGAKAAQKASKKAEIEGLPNYSRKVSAYLGEGLKKENKLHTGRKDMGKVSGFKAGEKRLEGYRKQVNKELSETISHSVVGKRSKNVESEASYIKKTVDKSNAMSKASAKKKAADNSQKAQKQKAREATKKYNEQVTKNKSGFNRNQVSVYNYFLKGGYTPQKARSLTKELIKEPEAFKDQLAIIRKK